MKNLKLPCQCIGKCGEIDLRDMGDKSVEINFYEDKKLVAGVYLEEKEIREVIKYLSKVICKQK